MDKLAGPAVLFLYLTAVTLATGAFENSLDLTDFAFWPAINGALALLVLPWTTHKITRAATAGVVGFAIITRIYEPLAANLYTAALLWLTILAGVISAIGSDQDKPLASKLTDTYR